MRGGGRGGKKSKLYLVFFYEYEYFNVLIRLLFSSSSSLSSFAVFTFRYNNRGIFITVDEDIPRDSHVEKFPFPFANM